MRKPVKLAVGIYLGTILIITSSYLILILIGSFQGNDMKGAVTDVKNTEHMNSSASNKTNTNSQLYKFAQNLQLQIIPASNNHQLVNSLYKAPLKIPAIE